MVTKRVNAKLIMEVMISMHVFLFTLKLGSQYHFEIKTINFVIVHCQTIDINQDAPSNIILIKFIKCITMQRNEPKCELLTLKVLDYEEKITNA